MRRSPLALAGLVWVLASCGGKKAPEVRVHPPEQGAFKAMGFVGPTERLHVVETTGEGTDAEARWHWILDVDKGTWVLTDVRCDDPEGLIPSPDGRSWLCTSPLTTGPLAGPLEPPPEPPDPAQDARFAFTPSGVLFVMQPPAQCFVRKGGWTKATCPDVIFSEFQGFGPTFLPGYWTLRRGRMEDDLLWSPLGGAAEAVSRVHTWSPTAARGGGVLTLERQIDRWQWTRWDKDGRRQALPNLPALSEDIPVHPSGEWAVLATADGRICRVDPDQVSDTCWRVPRVE